MIEGVVAVVEEVKRRAKERKEMSKYTPKVPNGWEILPDHPTDGQWIHFQGTPKEFNGYQGWPGEGHRFLIPGEDTWEEGDEFFRDSKGWLYAVSPFGFKIADMAIGRRKIPKDSLKESGDHYNWEHKGIRLDPYRIEQVCGPWHPAQAHAIKKLMRAGKSVKDLKQDINETIATLNRWLEMIEEDGE